MTLLTQSDQRNGTSVSNDLLRLKVEQAIVNKAVLILREAPAGQGDSFTIAQENRRTFARGALAGPQNAAGELLPYIVQNAIITAGGGECPDNDLLFVVQTEVIDAIYPTD